MPKRKRMLDHPGKVDEQPAAASVRKPCLMPWTDCRKQEAPLRLEDGREGLCGCPECHPGFWCSAVAPDGSRCARLRVRNGDARGTPYCAEHYRALVLGDSDGVPLEFLRAVVRAVTRAQTSGRLLVARSGWSSTAGLLAARYLPLAHRAGLVDDNGQPTFDVAGDGPR